MSHPSQSYFPQAALDAQRKLCSLALSIRHLSILSAGTLDSLALGFFSLLLFLELLSRIIMSLTVHSRTS